MSNSGLHSLNSALTHFVGATETQSAGHIGPLHWHLAERLVLECGFRPEYITPRPPFRCRTVGSGSNTRHLLEYGPEFAIPGEQTIIGGLKTKDVDVVVALPGVGPCLAISVKGTLNAFRNLTNRMEEAAGDCTNIHMAYPALAYGFLHVIRGNREASISIRNDIAIFTSGSTSEQIVRYHDAMSRLTSRRDIRDDVSRYEAVALLLIETDGPGCGTIMNHFPVIDSPLRFEWFFPHLLDCYDLRFVYAAPALKSLTQRLEWDVDSQLEQLALQHAFSIRCPA